MLKVIEKYKKQAEILMSKFSDVRILEETEYEFHFYYITHKEIVNPIQNLYKRNLDEIYKSNLNWKDIYFTTEVKINLMPRGGHASYSHQFQLDLDHLKILLQRFCPDSYIILGKHQSVRIIFENYYDKLAQYLLDYNGFVDNYEAIANFICEHKYVIHSQKIGI